jgi:hypothetical protein
VNASPVNSVLRMRTVEITNGLSFAARFFCRGATMDNVELVADLLARISFLEGAVLRLASVEDTPPVDDAPPAQPAQPAPPPPPPIDDALFYTVKFPRSRRRRLCSVCKKPGHDKRKHRVEK